MSSTSFIRLKASGVANAPDGLDGYASVFPWAQKVLDALSPQLGVTPPADFVFVDAKTLKSATGGHLPPDTLRRIRTQPQWHDPSHGVRTFATLLAHIRAHPQEVHRLIGEHNDLPSVELTVDVMRRILEAAAQQGDVFRIEHEF
jgi:hypothetical protein